KDSSEKPWNETGHMRNLGGSGPAPNLRVSGAVPTPLRQIAAPVSDERLGHGRFPEQGNQIPTKRPEGSSHPQRAQARSTPVQAASVDVGGSSFRFLGPMVGQEAFLKRQ